MKNSLLAFAFLLIGSAVFAQNDSLYFETYDAQVMVQKDLLSKFEAPQAISTCNEDDNAVVITHKDAKFSGGKHGTIERTWIAKDTCGNEVRTVQYIMLTD